MAGEPNVPLAMIYNTTRCGSMVICDLLAAGGAAVLKEPDALTWLLFHPMAEELAPSAFKVLCACATRRHSWETPRSMVVIKPRGHCTKLLPMLTKAAPYAQNFFLYRQGLDTVNSMTRAYGSQPIDVLRQYTLRSPVLRRLFPSVVPAIKFGTVLCDEAEFEWLKNDATFLTLEAFERNTLVYGFIVRSYLKARNSGVRITGIWYEDLVKQPAKIASKVFKACSLDPVVKEAEATKALGNDSHAGGLFSSGRLKGFKMPAVSLEEDARHRLLCKKLGVPMLDTKGKEAILPGTIFLDAA
mmetsp:Transcript_73737/g.196527  ORF Transcript_73737/g.196527 Transcript_73737/m.196527 type:complete len:300 (-) Transcript_73737:47-946(-)